jgi:hypothetical protein
VQNKPQLRLIRHALLRMTSDAANQSWMVPPQVQSLQWTTYADNTGKTAHRKMQTARSGSLPPPLIKKILTNRPEKRSLQTFLRAIPDVPGIPSDYTFHANGAKCKAQKPHYFSSA